MRLARFEVTDHTHKRAVGRDKLLVVSSRDACTITVKCQSALTLALNTVFFAVNDRATTEVANASCLLL